MRIPRKIKKKFKKLWLKEYGISVFIIKKSIDYSEWNCSEGKTVYGCITRPKNIKL
jgi:hypothetical protein